MMRQVITDNNCSLAAFSVVLRSFRKHCGNVYDCTAWNINSLSPLSHLPLSRAMFFHNSFSIEFYKAWKMLTSHCCFAEDGTGNNQKIVFCVYNFIVLFMNAIVWHHIHPGFLKLLIVNSCCCVPLSSVFFALFCICLLTWGLQSAGDIM